VFFAAIPFLLFVRDKPDAISLGYLDQTHSGVMFGGIDTGQIQRFSRG